MKFKHKKQLLIPPGETIKEVLKDRHINFFRYARYMELSWPDAMALLRGGLRVTTNTALKLELLTGVPDTFWANLEKNYRDEIMSMLDNAE